MKLHKIFGWLLMLVIPALAWTAYLYATRMTRAYDALLDYGVLMFMLIVGIAGVWVAFSSPRSRAVVSVLYLAVAGYTMNWGMHAAL